MLELALSLEQAQLIITTHAAPSGSEVAQSIELLENRGYGAQELLVRLINPEDKAYLISTSPNDGIASTSAYHTNSLATVQYLHTLIESTTSWPVPTLHVLDTSRSLYPESYILYSLPSSLLPTPSPSPSTNPGNRRCTLADAILSERQAARVDLELGMLLKQLHGIQNDWFDLPLPAGRSPQDPSYSWQDTFTLLLETVLDELKEREEEMKEVVEGIRKSLSIAIGSFLFDDVEVPSLIWFTGFEEDVVVDVSGQGEGGDGEARISMIFPRFEHAVWGDPAMEAFMSEPSRAMVEGYGSPPLVVFKRQRIKRLWYDLFLGMVVLTRHPEMKQREWWVKQVHKYATLLRDAPCS